MWDTDFGITAEHTINAFHSMTDLSPFQIGEREGESGHIKTSARRKAGR